MSMSSFRDVTILHSGDGDKWASYIIRSFHGGQLNLKLEKVNLESLRYNSDPADELREALQTSLVVIILTSAGFLTYMESRASWLVASLKAHDSTVTSLFAVYLGVDLDDVMGVCLQHGYDMKSWHTFDLSVDSTNLPDLVTEVLGCADNNSARRTVEMTNMSPHNSSTIHLIPSTAPQPGERTALIFTEEITDQVTAYLRAKTSERLTLTQINPHCLTFITPELKDEATQLIIEVDGRVKLQVKWSQGVHNCQYSVLALLRQVYHVNTDRDLDLVLAQLFKDSVCADVNTLTQSLRDTSQLEPRVDTYPSILHWASAYGLRELIAAILSIPAGSAMGHVMNSEGRKPAEMALSNGHLDISKFIEQFLETEAMAEACVIYVQTFKNGDNPTEEIGGVYEIMSAVKSQPPPGVAGITVGNTDPDTLYEYVGPDTLFPLPSGAMGSHAQGELISIQQAVKQGEFTFSDAGRLFSAWKYRYQSGYNQSFKDKMTSLAALREEYSPTLSAIKHSAKRMSNIPIVDTDNHLQVPGKPTLMEPLVNYRASKTSQLSYQSTDSGRYSSLSGVSSDSLNREETSLDLDQNTPDAIVLHPWGKHSYSQKRPASRCDIYLELMTSDLNQSDKLQAPPLPPRPVMHGSSATLPRPLPTTHSRPTTPARPTTPSTISAREPISATGTRNNSKYTTLPCLVPMFSPIQDPRLKPLPLPKK